MSRAGTGRSRSAASGGQSSSAANTITAQETSHEYRPSAVDGVLAEQGLERYHLRPPTWRAPWIVEQPDRPDAATGKNVAPAQSVGFEAGKPLIRLAGAPALLPVPGSSGAVGAAVTGSDTGAAVGSGSSGTTWPVFYPPHDGMDEDRLTEHVVKQGFAAKSLVQAETFSAHQHIYDKLKTGDVLGNLSRLVAAVRTKAEARLPSYGPPTFRLPSRITLTDSKREAWFSDLASPSVPLSKLSRSVPHGYKGEKGLDMLANRKVEIDRAVWFVRAFGGVEIQSLAKTRPLATAIYLYTTDFTTVVCEFLRRQLAEVVLPSSAGPGTLSAASSNHPSPLGPPVAATMASAARARSGSLSMQAKAAAASAAAAAAMAATGGDPGIGETSPLIDEEKRKRWEEKYDYTVKLASSLHHENLLDRPQFLRFLVSLLEPTPSLSPGDTIGQTSFVLVLIEDSLEDILASEPETARLASGCMTSLKELDLAAPSPFRDRLKADLSRLVRSCFAANPDAFAPLLPYCAYASPAFSSLDPGSLEQLLVGQQSPDDAGRQVDDELAMRDQIYSDIAELRARRLLLSPTLQESPAGTSQGSAAGSAVEDRARLAAVQHLDAFESPQRMQDLHQKICIVPASTEKLSWPNLLPFLFTYSTGASRRCEPHRRYIAARLVSLEGERLGIGDKRVTRSTAAETGVRVEDAFVRWVDDLDSSVSRQDVRALAEELCRIGIMNYGAYLQRMIARGETERNVDSEGSESLHLWILRTVPLEQSLAGVKRRVASTGKAGSDRLQRIEQHLAAARTTVQRIFSRAGDPTNQTSDDPSEMLATLRELAQDGAQWIVTRELLPTAISSCSRSAAGELDLSRSTLAIVFEAFKTVEDWAGLAQLLAALLQLPISDDGLTQTVEVLESHLDVWAALDAISDFGRALCEALANLKKKDRPTPRRLLQALVAFAGHDLLDAEGHSALRQELHSLVSAASPPSNRPSALPPLPIPLPEMQSLLVDSSKDAMRQLSDSLWHRYRAHPAWITALLDSAILYIPQVAQVDILVDLLTMLDQKLPPRTFSAALAPWTSGMSTVQAESMFGGASGATTAAFFAELGLAGVLSPEALLHDLVAPVRRVMLRTLLQATTASEISPSILAILRTLQLVFAPVITPHDARIRSHSSSDHDLVRQQRIAARRASVTRRDCLSAIAEALAGVVIEQEAAKRLAFDVHADEAGAYFVRLASLPELQALFARYPRALRDGMLDNADLNALPNVKELRPNLLAGLLVVLKEGGAASPANLASTEDLDIFLSGLTIWRLNVSKIEIVACLERLELDPTISPPERYHALHTLSRHFLERVCSGDGKSYLGEQVVQCYSGLASDELVSVAFERLATAVNEYLRDDTEKTRFSVAMETTSALLDKLLQNGVAVSQATSTMQLLEAIKLVLISSENGALRRAEGAGAASDPALQAARLALLLLRCLGKSCDKATTDLLRDCLALFAVHAVASARGGTPHLQRSMVLFDMCSAISYSLPDVGPGVRPPTLPNLVNAPSPYALSADHLPDRSLERLVRIFGPLTPQSAVRNPWELLDHADPSATQAAVARKAAMSADTFCPPPTQLVNLGPVDLAAFRAHVIATVPAVTALDAVSAASASSTHSGGSSHGPHRFEKGRQTNFDFETPCTTLSVSARDHRRTLNVTRLVSSRLDSAAMASAQAAASLAASKKASNGAAAQSASPNGAAPAGGTPAKATPASRGMKRRSSQQQQGTASGAEIVVLDSDDEAGSSSAAKTGPKAKKARTSAGSAAGGGATTNVTGRTAAKTTAAKAPAKTARKRK